MDKLMFLTVLLFTAVSGKGVNRWCTHNNKYLSGYSSGTYAYTNFNTAKSQCLARSDCLGITRERGWRYTLRRGWVLKDSPSAEISYVPCSGYFNCDTFGLKSVHGGKFLSAQPSGSVEWNRGSYQAWEKIHFKQFGKDTGFLKSHHGKYLAATPSHRLEWNRPHTQSWEKFTVYQHEDKVAFKSNHGRYLSAQSDGTADVDRTRLGTWEWFTVYPQRCLSNIQCDCSKGINSNDYSATDIVYHTSRGTVEAFAPERVGYQYIDNARSSSEQTSAFRVSEEVTETASFTHTAGASITVGTEFEAGIPFVASATVYAEVSASYEFSAGTERSETKTMEAEYNCVAAPGKTVTCAALLFKYRASVPYTQTWTHKRLPCSCTTDGVFNEIAASEMRLTVEEDVLKTAGSGGFRNAK